MPYSCGSCNLCCYLLAIPDLQKPARMWCWNAIRPHGGCAVHKSGKPAACVDFECLWLSSQSQDDPAKQMAWDLRPNNCHVMFGPYDREDSTLLYVHVDPNHPTAWRAPVIMELIEFWLDRGAAIEVIVGEQHIEFPRRVLESTNEHPISDQISDL